VRLTYFGTVESGTWSQIDDPDAPPQRYDPRTTVDLNVGFRIAGDLQLTIGATNVFDVEPTEQDRNETENGALWENVQMGFNGAGYYTRLSWHLPGK
jgi:iron complex outermembrane receptor protein